jgi:putative tryptophan/tyrosine transport system substrate-binding protein
LVSESLSSAARPQQQARPLVGFVHTAAAAVSDHIKTSFSVGLRQMGYVDGENATIEFRWAEGRYDAFASLIRDVVAHHAAVIVTGGGNAIIEAAKAVTRTTPIVFVSGDDPVRAGTVSSLSRPDGNVTGFAFFNSVLAAKRIESSCPPVLQGTYRGYTGYGMPTLRCRSPCRL